MSDALRTALKQLRLEIDRTSDAHLPSVAELARKAGVAYVTMWKAVDMLRNEGVLEARPRRGIVVLDRGRPLPAPTGIEDAPAVRGHKWKSVRARLHADVLRGLYPPGTALPSRKELCTAQGVCGATLSKALSNLVRDGVLRRQGTRFVAASGSVPGRSNQVLLVACGHADGTLLLPHVRTADYLRSLEQTCALRGVSVTTLTYDRDQGRMHNPRAVTRLLADDSFTSRLLGVMIWQAGIDRHNWTDVVLQFAPLGLPMALFDETGEVTVPRLANTRNRMRRYTLGFSRQAGRQMGHVLLRLGHRRVAFLSPLHRALWSRNRLAGVREAFADAGLPDAVREYVLADYFLPEELAAHSSGVTDDIASRLATPSELADSDLHCRVLHSLEQQVPSVLQREAYAHGMLPLMEAALADEQATVWVAADDDTALPCIQFLHERGRRVPEDISVAGFDDSLAASMQKLTSYNYNGSAYMRAMLAHVIGPGSPESGPPGSASVEIEGSVVPRQTTGRPRPQIRESEHRRTSPPTCRSSDPHRQGGSAPRTCPTAAQA